MLDAGSFGQFFTIWVIVVTAMEIVHISFAIGVFYDASSLRNGTYFVPPIIWGLAVLIGGVFSAVAYWVLHHSTLSRQSEEKRRDLSSIFGGD